MGSEREIILFGVQMLVQWLSVSSVASSSEVRGVWCTASGVTGKAPDLLCICTQLFRWKSIYAVITRGKSNACGHGDLFGLLPSRHNTYTLRQGDGQRKGVANVSAEVSDVEQTLRHLVTSQNIHTLSII